MRPYWVTVWLMGIALAGAGPCYHRTVNEPNVGGPDRPLSNSEPVFRFQSPTGMAGRLEWCSLVPRLYRTMHRGESHRPAQTHRPAQMQLHPPPCPAKIAHDPSRGAAWRTAVRGGRAGTRRRCSRSSPGFQGWNTTDAEEMERRRWRGLTDIVGVDSLEPEHPYFGTFRARSSGSASYDVEIRALTAAENSCSCPDWHVNGLGTCKHIEGVLERLRHNGKRAFEAASRWGNPRAEIFPAIDGTCRVLVRPPAGRKDIEAVLAPLLDADGAVAGDPLDAAATVRTALAALPDAVIRESRQLEPRLEEERRRRRRIAARAAVPCRGRCRHRHARSCCAPSCCPTRSKACCTWRSASGCCWPTKWGSARRSRRSPRSNCCAAGAASSGSWSCFPHR